MVDLICRCNTAQPRSGVKEAEYTSLSQTQESLERPDPGKDLITVHHSQPPSYPNHFILYSGGSELLSHPMLHSFLGSATLKLLSKLYCLG